MYLVEDLRFKYADDWVLKDIRLTIRQGSFSGLIGPNGSGKTTLLKALCGMLNPQSGRVLLMERNLKDWSPRERARTVAYVPQECHFIYPFTVLEVVLMGRAPYTSLFGFDRPLDLNIAREALERVGLDSLAYRAIQTLSGGERQMALIARALVQKPGVLLLDEPTAFLDLSHQVDIYNTLRRLTQSEGMTILAVSHDLNLAAQYCNGLIIMKDGRIAARGSPEDTLTEETIRRVYGCTALVDPHPATGRPRVTLMPEVKT